MIFTCTAGVAVRGWLSRLCARDPVLPWVHTIARRVRVDNYRMRTRISSRETGVDLFPKFRRATMRRVRFGRSRNWRPFSQRARATW